MKKKLTAAFKALFPFLLAIILFLFELRFFDPVKIYKIISASNYKWALMGIVTALLANVVRAARWNMLLKPLGYKPRLINTYFSVQIGYLYNSLIPRGGEVSRCSMLAVYEKIPLDKSLGTVVTERVLDVLTLFLCVLLVFILEFQRLNNLVYEKIIVPKLTSIHNLTHAGARFYIIGIVGLVVLAAVIYLVWRLLRKSKYYSKIVDIVKGFAVGIQSIRKLDNTWGFIFLTVLMWLLYTAGAYVTFLSFEYTAGLSFLAAFVLMTFGAFAYATPVPNAFGIYPVFIAPVLLSYGVLNGNDQQAYGWLGWSVNTATIIVLGILSLILFPVINRSQLANNETTPAADTK